MGHHDHDVKPNLRVVSFVLMGFGVVSLFTALWFTTARGPTVRESLPPSGGLVGPLEVREANTVLEVEVRQSLPGLGWSFVEGAVLDLEEEYLFGFGEELWHEKGYDDGPWNEAKTDFDVKVTMPEPGDFYLGFRADVAPQMKSSDGAPKGVGPMSVKVSVLRGSAVPHFAAGIIALIFGIILFDVATKAIRNKMAELETD